MLVIYARANFHFTEPHFSHRFRALDWWKYNKEKHLDRHYKLARSGFEIRRIFACRSGSSSINIPLEIHALARQPSSARAAFFTFLYFTCMRANERAGELACAQIERNVRGVFGHAMPLAFKPPIFVSSQSNKSLGVNHSNEEADWALLHNPQLVLVVQNTQFDEILPAPQPYLPPSPSHLPRSIVGSSGSPSRRRKCLVPVFGAILFIRSLGT